MPKWNELKRYCEKNGWKLKRKKKHYKYEKIINKLVLKTSVSLSLGDEIPKNLFKSILKHQLGITKEKFNRNS